MQAASTLTAKAQTTLPREVREKLSLRPSNTIVYEIEGDTVRLRKQMPMDAAHLWALRAMLSESETPEDAAAYDGL